MINKIYFKYRYQQKAEWDRIALSYMSGKVLDVGCGNGRFVSLSPDRITGIDNNTDNNCIHGNATDLPFSDNSFNAVHCSHLIEHLLPEDAYKLLKEMDRVLKPNGILCIRTPLLHSGFYNDFTHIKPYYPKAIMKYFGLPMSTNRTFKIISDRYKVVKLKYRYALLFNRRPFRQIAKLLRLFSPKRNGYMLILKKESE